MSRISEANSSSNVSNTSSTRTHPIRDQDSRSGDEQPQNKRRRVMVEELLGEDNLSCSAARQPANDTQPQRERATVEAADEDALPHLSAKRPSLPNSGGSVNPVDPESQNLPPIARNRLRRYKGFFVEEFPDPTAGAPISDERTLPPDLGAYMRRCGPMADPEHFEVAELLMTSKLTNADKDRHLKSRKYAGKTPWPHCGAMVLDVDILAHGPEFKKGKIEIFDGRRPRPQYMVYRNIIEVIRDFLRARRPGYTGIWQHPTGGGKNW
ncbi:hypothetical protein RSOL_172170, partial [Rhizoctonia solani AG-3 Rhs1AP]